MNSRDAVLSALLGAGGAYVSGQAVGSALGISRAAVHRHVETLRGEGYGIESAPNLGYRLDACPDRLDPARVSALLTTRFLGREIRCLPSVDSTNSYMKRWAEQGAPDGALALAEEQTKGAGRRGRSWLCARGEGVTMSFLLRPGMPPGEAQKITLAAAAAVCGAIGDVCPALRPSIKWPNDILLGGRKVCGILTELSAAEENTHYVVVGVGVNVRGRADGLPSEIREIAATLDETCGATVDRCALAAAICNRFEQLWFMWTRDGGFAPVLERYRERMAHVGRAARALSAGRTAAGTIMGVDAEGSLLMECAGNMERIRSGEVELVRLAEKEERL